MTPRVLRVLGIGFLVAGAGLMVERMVFIANSMAVVGTIVAMDSTRYTIRFQKLEGGEEITRPLPTDADERERLRVGQQVPLRFELGHPQEARPFGVDFWFFPVGLLLVGALGLFAARYRRSEPVTSSAPPAGR